MGATDTIDPPWGGDGWMAVPGVLSEDEVRTILRQCHEVIFGPETELVGRDKPAAGTRHLVRLDDRIPAVAELVSRGPITDIVASVLGDDAVLGEVSLRSPQPGFGAQHLHTDDVAQNHADARTLGVTCIVSLVAFTEANGATRVVPGSHLRPDLQRAAQHPKGPPGADHADQLTLVGPAGTAFVFSAHLLHSGTQNRSEADRPALQIVWRAHGAGGYR